MWGWTTNINAHSSARLPFWNCSIPRLKLMISNIAWTAKSMESWQIILEDFKPASLLYGVQSLAQWMRLFRGSLQHLSAKGNKIVEIYSRSIRLARRSVWPPSVNSLIFCSAIPFWWWLPTPQKIVHWLQEVQSSQNPLPANHPLSAWKAFEVTPIDERNSCKHALAKWFHWESNLA